MDVLELNWAIQTTRRIIEISIHLKIFRFIWVLDFSLSNGIMLNQKSARFMNHQMLFHSSEKIQTFGVS